MGWQKLEKGYRQMRRKILRKTMMRRALKTRKKDEKNLCIFLKKSFKKSAKHLTKKKENDNIDKLSAWKQAENTKKKLF